MHEEHIHFITGRLAESSLRNLLTKFSEELDLVYSIQVMPITVAALLTPKWIAPRLDVPPETTKILLPGYCEGDLAPVEEVAGLPVERGPRDLRQLPEYLGGQASAPKDYGGQDIEILAEINHAPRLTTSEILAEARRLGDDGADIIDIGCVPGEIWSGVAESVRALRDEGHRVSIDSMEPAEIGPAVEAGAELVLSVNSTNREAALDWGCEVVVIPDDPATLAELDSTIDFLAAAGVPMRIDPVLEPIGFGFAASLERYFHVRSRYRDAEMMMGIGNLTELTEVDSAGINLLLLALCEELGIRSVLTTQVINWARGSVRECDIARRLAYYAVRNSLLPKHVDAGLVMLRDAKLYPIENDELEDLAAQIKDSNYRIFADNCLVHLVGSRLHLAERDPFLLFEKLLATGPKNLDASHSFYLGYEMCKAATAMTLGKQYRQDEALDWGWLTVQETRHRLAGGKKQRESDAGK